MPRKRRTKDASQKAVTLLAKVTKTAVPKGEDLLGSPELKRQLAEAKRRLGER